MVRIDIRVVPRAPRSAIDGLRNGRVVVRVTAPPVDQAANDATIELLAEALRLPRRSLRIVSGATSRNKTVEIASIDAGQLAERLRLPRP